MASTVEFVEYVCGQISDAGNITYKKMFGDYGVYCNDKIIGLICDNQFFVKKTVVGKEILGEAAEEDLPYKNAKPQFVISSLEDREFLGEFIRKTFEELPSPKPKKKKI